MSAGILRLPTLILAVLCLAIVARSQDTICAAVCQTEPPSCPYGQVRPLIIVQLILVSMIY